MTSGAVPVATLNVVLAPRMRLLTVMLEAVPPAEVAETGLALAPKVTVPVPLMVPAVRLRAPLMVCELP